MRPPRAAAPRERKSTNKYTLKNNRYRDHLKTLEGYRLAVARARAANNTYICRAKAAFINAKKAELDRLSEEEQHEAYDEIARRSRQHSVLSMYTKSYCKSFTGLTHTRLYLDIHWVQKARRLAPAGPWPSINEVLRGEGIPRRKYNSFKLDSKLGSRGWNVDLSKFGVLQRAAQKGFKFKP